MGPGACFETLPGASVNTICLVPARSFPPEYREGYGKRLCISKDSFVRQQGQWDCVVFFGVRSFQVIFLSSTWWQTSTRQKKGHFLATEAFLIKLHLLLMFFLYSLSGL